MFNIQHMLTLGEIIKGLLEFHEIKQADLVRRVCKLDPKLTAQNVQVGISQMILRNSLTSKYLPLIAKAFDLTAQQFIEWHPNQKNKALQKRAEYPEVITWPFGDRVSPQDYETLSDEQKEVVISRIVSFLDENKVQQIMELPPRKSSN